MVRCLKKIKTRKGTIASALIPARKLRWRATADLVREEPNDEYLRPLRVATDGQALQEEKWFLEPFGLICLGHVRQGNRQK